MKKNIPNILLVFNVICLIYIGLLCFYNQFALDDFCLYNSYLKKGFNSPLNFWWLEQNGRYLPLYFCNLAFILFHKTGNLFLGSFALYVLLIYSIKELLNSIFSKFSILLENWQLYNLAFFISHIILFNNFKFSTFFWLTGQWMYIGGFAFFFLCLSFWNKENLNIYNWLVIIFSYWFAGCSAENYALSFITINLALVFFVKNQKNLSLKIGLFVLIISFLSLLISPGSQHRLADNIGTESSFLSQIMLFIKIFPNRMLQFLGLSFMVHLPLGMAFVLVCQLFFNKINLNIGISINTFLSKNKLYLIAFLLLLIIENIAPVVFALGQIGDQRTLSFTNILLVLLYFILFYNLFSKLKLNMAYSFASVILTCWIIGISFKILTEYPKLVLYKKSQLVIMQRILKPSNIAYNYKNQEQLYSPNFGNVLVNYLINNYLPTKKSFIKALTNEPLWINRIENIDQKVFTDCMCGALQSKIIVDKVKE